MVWRLLKMKGRQYDKTHLVSWWVGRYSRRGLPLRGRGAYGPVLTHGPRVVAAEAAGAEALVGVLKIIKDASYNKTIQPPWRAMEKRQSSRDYSSLSHHRTYRSVYGGSIPWADYILIALF